MVFRSTLFFKNISSYFPTFCFYLRPSSLLLIIGLGLSTTLTACIPSDSVNSTNAISPVTSSVGTSNSGDEVENRVIRIGYQKFGTLSILKARENLEQRFKSQGITVQWVLFPAGPQLLEAINAGSIDFGHTGEAPPLFAQAAGVPLKYIANQTPNPKAEGILVHQDSTIKTVKDLKGKKIALNKGSNVHYLLVKALEAANIKYEEVETVFLPPADARAAFEQGSVDAWAIWDPFYTAAKQATNARILEDGEGLVANREFYLADQSFADRHWERIQIILEETEKADIWANTHVTEAAQLLSPELGIDVAVLEEVLQRRPSGIETIKPEVIKEQQQIADTFYQLKLLPKPVQVQEVAQTNN
ncbi:aliphatic sulfonates ABC transporter substrate-binding protein [Chondrocystis sp. NIES-4102]|nr:aliphatic sulfonates ABC transporter substrate-binding protein [Chondrocystis sp. NIES-4102]